MMLPSERSESLNAISNSLAEMHLGSGPTPGNDVHKNHARNRLRSSKTSDCLVGHKTAQGGIQSKPLLSGGVKKHVRVNMSFSNARFFEIQRENRRLLGEILKKTTSLPGAIRQRPKRPSSASFSPIMKNSRRRVSAPNANAVSFYTRQKERQRIEMENLALHRRLQSIHSGASNRAISPFSQSSSHGMKRASSVPRFASLEHLDNLNESQFDDENVSSFEI